MASKTSAIREKLLQQLAELVRKKLPEEQANLLSQFLHQYYATVATEDLVNRDIMDLYGAVLSHWSLMYQRKPGQIKLHIYNPQFEQHGWQSTHTIIEIALDDMPFIVDSILMELNRRGLTTHMIFHTGGFRVKRDKKNRITEILPPGSTAEGTFVGAPIYIEIDRITDKALLQELEQSIHAILADVRACVTDWRSMIDKTHEVIKELETNPPKCPPCNEKDVNESIHFLKWIANNHFTFLGYREYSVIEQDNTKVLQSIANTGLGVLRDGGVNKISRLFSNLSKQALEVVLSPELLLVTKTNTKSTVHRPAYTDMISIKQFDDKGAVIGEKRIVGLFTSVAYNSRPMYIPLLRHKVEEVMRASKLSMTGHAGKALLNILENLPRDDLIQSGTRVDELLELAMGVLHLQERRQIRLFIKEDVFKRYISCLVFVPRDRFNTELRLAMQNVLMQDLNGIEVEFQTLFSDSNLARIHFMIRLDPANPPEYDLSIIEKKLIEIGRSWEDDLRENVIDTYGEEKGNQYIIKYLTAFPVGYREHYSSTRTAVIDIGRFESLKTENDLQMSLSKPLEQPEDRMRFKLYRLHNPMPLSDALPVLENMGLRVVGEEPYRIQFKDKTQAWINDFSLTYSIGKSLDIDSIKDNFQETFAKVWYGLAENDGFNQLTLLAKLNWREISVLRAFAKYFKQIGFTFSQNYIEETLVKYPHIAAKLVNLFNWRFNPELAEKSKTKIEHLENEILTALDAITNLDEDRILRQYYEIINATLRTNYFQLDDDNHHKEYISFKFDPTKIPYLPLPYPMFEIFVYSPWVEGVHLRSGKVARGGLRWSDRREDFRTEVLGLMKAQRVKNSVIVPSGAKGGFIPKQLPVTKNRDEILSAAVSAYKMFIRGLLDLTDNVVAGNIVPPKQVVRYDEDDHYLVVAADKGTATFSDYANSVSVDYGFWLGDAFASGGQTGYDHKKMGITAKGAWESVKRHFRELGINTQKDPFTVVGIGDMAGDVFGNGMLLSKKIKLVGAFNHQHIFIDPDPNPETSYKERQRLFALPRSSWEDYDTSLISKGGGIFNRLVKAIKLSPEMKKLLDVKKDYMEPNELIRSLLKSPIDLLWNGGIGTFVKAADERDEDVGDRANDPIRINGGDLRCRVVGEGGNLGCTQLGRIEFALNGGKTYTDFIDNSAGVDCSDHEVNIKILLNNIVADGDMTEKQRNELLASMTDDVSNLVLPHNYHQTQAISIATKQASYNMDVYARIMSSMEEKGALDRDIEFLPDDHAIHERKSLTKGLTAPEISVILSYAKILLKEDILSTDIPEDKYLSSIIFDAFPKRLVKQFRHAINQHSLSREIIATQISNKFINNMGVTFIQRINEQTGANVSSIIRAFTIADNLFGYHSLMLQIEKLDYKISSETQTEMLLSLARFMRRVTRWFLLNFRDLNHIKQVIKEYSGKVKELIEVIPSLLIGSGKEDYESAINRYVEEGVSESLAKSVAISSIMYSVLDIISAANEHLYEVTRVAKIYASLANRLDLPWFKQRITSQPEENQWESLAKAAYRDDLDAYHRQMTISVLNLADEGDTVDVCVDKWVAQHEVLVSRWYKTIAEIRSSNSVDYVMYSVALRELQDINRECINTKAAVVCDNAPIQQQAQKG